MNIMKLPSTVVLAAAAVAFSLTGAPAAAQSGAAPPPSSAPAKPPQGAAPAPSLPVAPAGASSPTTTTTPPPLPSDYVIGVDDVLAISFWRDPDMTADPVVVRPDGRISMPILNEIEAAGLTPEQLRLNITEAAMKFKDDPIVQVAIKQVNSRRVFLMGEVAKPGPYPLSSKLTVMQLLALAGGVSEYANKEEIAVLRTENGRPRSYRVNYKDIMRGRNLQQNIELKVGDTIVVP